jgi:anthranilate synthase component II
MKILLIDFQDSFTWNIADYLARCGATVTVKDSRLVRPGKWDSFQGLVFSPGPGNPSHMPHLQALLASAVQQRPVLGICLGFQALGHHFGARLEKGQPVHGKESTVRRRGESWLLSGLPESFSVVRYHSLVVRGETSPLRPVLHSVDGEIMALEHPTLPVAGVQYHPEAWLSEFGLEVLENWLRRTRR